MALVTWVQHLYTFNIVALTYHLLPNVWKAPYTITTSIFVHVPYWQPHNTDKFISYVVPGPSHWLFHFDKKIALARTHIRWVWWMFKNLPLPAAQEVRDSSDVTPCIVMKNDVVLYHQVSSFSSESMRLQSLRQSERITMRDLVQYKKWTYPCYRAVNTEHPELWTGWWCTTPSKHWRNINIVQSDLYGTDTFLSLIIPLEIHSMTQF